MGRFDVLLPRAGPRSLVEPGVKPGSSTASVETRGPTFDEILAGEVGGRIKISAHARERLAARGVELSAVDLDRMAQVMDRLAAKGARESLLVGEKVAFVVSVPNRTVITAVPRDELKAQIFTQIDSAALMD